MPLDRYCKNRRIVALSSSTSAYDAVRALENNHIGAILVHAEGRLVGIITDRDLACRIIGFSLAPEETILDDVMTPDPATVTLQDSESLVAELMRDRHVRRVPVLDAGKIAGIVTLDDLILSSTVDPSSIAAIIQGQLAEPAHAKPAGETHPMRAGCSLPREARGAARAAETLRDFESRLTQALGIHDHERALMALQVVASGLVRRLSPEHANDFASQFPSSLRDWLLDLPAGPDRHVTRASIDAEMAERLHIDPEDADFLVQKVGAALHDLLSASEVEHVATLLPLPMKEILAPRSTPG